MTIRNYDPEKDYPSSERIWKEVGWIKGNQSAHFKTRLDAGRSYVSELDGGVECLVTCADSLFQYQDKNIPSTILTGVTTSLIARKSGIASKLTAHAISEEAMRGSDLLILCMFEQGFYNRLGFGTGAYENLVKFHPSQLNVSDLKRSPQRLDIDQYQQMHANHLHRKPGHGKTSFKNPLEMKVQLLEHKNGVGLGFFDGPNGQLSHHLWLYADNTETGPYRVLWMAYETNDQFLELIATIKSLGDQIKLMEMVEPAEIQFQDLLNKPILQSAISAQGRFEQITKAFADKQYRICNLENVLKLTHLECETFQFNLQLHDPVSKFISESNQWKGISGDYIITLGEKSFSEPGTKENIPNLKASVGAFTRLWLGTSTATSLSMTDELSGPEDLLVMLNKAFRLPKPVPDLDF